MRRDVLLYFALCFPCRHQARVAIYLVYSSLGALLARKISGVQSILATQTRQTKTVAKKKDDEKR